MSALHPIKHVTGTWDMRPQSIAAAPPASRATSPNWLYLLSQVVLVAGIELIDDGLHAMAPHANAAAGLGNALQVVNFERAHDFWVEPGVQRFFAGNHEILGQRIGWTQIRPIFNGLYGQGHVLFTLAFAFWVYFFRRPLFSFIRNVFVLTGLMAVAIYELFPLAPPRLAEGLSYQGHSYHFLDTVFGNGGIQLSFNEYAAMPSVHVAWALIVGLTLWGTARPWPVRVLGLIYPFVMLTTVIVTGNHYLSDGLGALGVVCLATIVSAVIASRAHHALPARSPRHPRMQERERSGEPVTTSIGSRIMHGPRAAAAMHAKHLVRRPVLSAHYKIRRHHAVVAAHLHCTARKQLWHQHSHPHLHQRIQPCPARTQRHPSGSLPEHGYCL